MTVRQAFWAVALAVASLAAAAETFPSRPITIVVPFAAGGNGDLRARQLAVSASKELGQPVIVDNRPGASGNLGMAYVARAKPDGYTLGMGAIGPLATNQFLYPAMGFDPSRDFDPILLVEKSPLALSMRFDKPYRSLADVIAAARARPGALAIGNTGQGGSQHLAAELFQQAAKIELIGVPYKGGGPAANAVLGGEVEMMFELTYAVVPSVQAGRTRALAVTSETRLKAMPDVPTMIELGYPQVDTSYWLGLVGPKGLPPEVIRRLNETFARALASAEMRGRIEAAASTPGGGSPADFAAFMDAERRRWGPVIKSRNLKLD